MNKSDGTVIFCWLFSLKCFLLTFCSSWAIRYLSFGQGEDSRSARVVLRGSLSVRDGGSVSFLVFLVFPHPVVGWGFFFAFFCYLLGFYGYFSLSNDKIKGLLFFYFCI